MPNCGAVILALEFDREGANLALADPNGAAQFASRLPWPSQTPPATQWLRAMQACRDLAFRAALEIKEIERVGVAYDGLIASGIAQTDPTRPGFAGYDIPRAVREHLGLENVVAASKTDCQARGEARFGALQDQKSYHYLHLGADLGGASCFQGQMLTGDIGGLILDIGGALDAFGKRGTLRAFCSGAALESRARSYGMTGQSAAEIWDLSPSNFAAQQLCEEFTSRLAQGLSGAVSLFEAPICIGGAVGLAIWPQIGEALASKLREMAPKSPQLRVGALGDDAGTLGAIALAMQAEF